MQPSSKAAVVGIKDLHHHILPGVDDGAPDVGTSLDMARIAVAQGIETVVATPHTLDGVYDVERTRAKESGERLRRELEDHRVPLEIRVAAEVRLHEGIEALLESDPTVTLDGGGRFLLLELPHDSVPPRFADFLFRLRARGTTPVIAHPERNLIVRANPDITREWVRTGILMQVTAASLDGTFGPVIKECCGYLLKERRVHVIATDAHRASRRPPRIQAAIAAAGRIVGEDRAQQLVVDNPALILAGAQVASIETPEPVATRRFFDFLLKK